ncbi:hypothetical protein [Nocardioides sediminis]|uniref:hypothetical protein n=1 Tax=Nocardioides sediminis TaxID=433648 RepID=UPI000D317AAA|nr:hypothetical protein [Nocardioides sediminis]
MSERLLEALREEAELATPVPAFELIEAAGRTRRRRRHAVAGSVAACVLAVTGLLAATDRDGVDARPADDGTADVTPYPGARMTTLPEGTYELEPAHRSRPIVQFTLPAGWNSWVGPNRFEGLGDEVSDHAGANNEVLDQDPDWYLGVLFMDVEWIAQRSCTMTDVRGDDTATLVRSLTQVPRLRVTSGPEDTVRFGRPAVHLRLQEQGGTGKCLNDAMFHAAVNAGITYLGRGTTYEAWVIDLDGRPLVVWAGWTRKTPSDEVRSLLEVIDSIEIHDRE